MVAGRMTREEIGNLYHTSFIEKFGLKDLMNRQRSNLMGSKGRKGHTFEDGR